jgi:hypothetical protein
MWALAGDGALALLLAWTSVGLAQAADCAAITPSAKIAEVGAFSNMRHTEEHAYGQTVMLWRAGECLFGLFESSQGLAGDTPIGMVQDVEYDRKTGRLSFAAKLTIGVMTFGGPKGPQPARDLFAFRGDLDSARLTGVITHVLQNSPEARPTADHVAWPLSNEITELMRGSRTYGEWLARWQPILRQRGPKW